MILKVKFLFLSIELNLFFNSQLENPYAWLISSPKKSFIVRANSDRERQEWLTHLDRCIHHISGGHHTQQNAVAAHWVPDDKSDTCMHCRSTKFSTYNRKHV